MSYNEKLIESKLITLHTAFAGKVLSVSDKYAAVQPLTYAKAASGKLTEQAVVSAYIPDGVKTQIKTITYLTSVSGAYESADVLIRTNVEAGDIVFCGVCERDFAPAQLSGQITEPTRRHDANDAVILAVL